jgi:uncharacterized protein (TIGR02452 family)
MLLVLKKEKLMPSNFIFYPSDFEFPVFKKQDKECDIKVLPLDTLSAAVLLQNSCCLNFASHKSPGGGYKGTAQAQEEYLFRRTNLPEIMDNEECRKYYPLRNVEAIYCPNVQVNKGVNLEDITSFNISVITLPAISNPNHLVDNPFIQKRIERIFEIAAFYERKNLILGCWGCGVFKNDPNIIASIFYGSLFETFKNIFEKVIFAIPDENSKNYITFKNILL